MPEVLVKEYRGNVVENVHYGAVAVVSSTGETLAYAGDIEKQTYMRSASKPIQVLPTLLAGLHEKYKLTSEEVAIFNSSHWGSNHHMYVLEDIIKKTGLSDEDMIMNPSYSTSASPLADKLIMGKKLNPVEGKSRLQHCCSGKHLSLMLLQRELTGDVKGYHLPDSPVQKEIISFISMLSQTPTFRIGIGIDGCGVPVFALPMRNIALAYAKLADPFNLPEETKKAIEYNFECINKNPEKINDYFTPSYYVNKNPDLLMKDGSRGVICIAIRSKKLGIVIKLEDGWSDEFQGLIVARVLEQLKYDAPELIEQLKSTYNTTIYNDCHDEVGHAEVDFNLNINPSYYEELYGEEYVSENSDGEDSDGANSKADTEEEQNGESSDNTSTFSKHEKNGLYDNGYTGDYDEFDDYNVPEKELTPEELARQKSIRNRKSILGQNIVMPSTGKPTYIQNPMSEPIRTVKSAKVLSTISGHDDNLMELNSHDYGNEPENKGQNENPEE